MPAPTMEPTPRKTAPRTVIHLDLAGRDPLYCWHQERYSFTLLVLLACSRWYGDSEYRASPATG